MENAGKQKLFNQAALARFLNVSPSTIARIVEPLVKQKIVLFDRFERGMKILALNEEEVKTRVLIEFYEKLRRL